MSDNSNEFEQHFPLIAAHLDSSGVEIFTRALVPVEATAGDVLISSGVESDTLYLIRKGLLAISIEADGKKLLLGEAGEGKWVGEITMLYPGPATTTVVAEEDSALLALSYDAFEKLREDHLKVASSLLKALSLDLTNRLRLSRQLLVKINEDQYFVENAGADKKDRLAALGRALMGLSEEKT